MKTTNTLFAGAALLSMGIALSAGARAETAAVALDDIIVTASRGGVGIPVDQLGGSVSVIDTQALEQRQTRQVSDILRDIPGIAVSRADGPAGRTQIRVRGSEANHVLVMIDGIKASDPSAGEFDFGQLIADDAARIEVLRGQQSSLYGSEAIGGVVNYITLDGREAPGMRFRIEGGSFETISSSARIAGVKGDVDYALIGSYYHTGGAPTARGGQRDIGSDTTSVSAKVNWTPTDNFKLSSVLRYNHNNTDSNKENEIYVMDWDTGELTYVSPNFGMAEDSYGTHNTADALYGMVRAELTALDDRWVNALSAQFVDTERKTFDVPDNSISRIGQSVGFRYGYQGRRYRGSYESSFRFDSETVKQRLTVALDAEREEYRNISPTDVNPGVFAGKHQKDTIGLVAQYDASLFDRITLGGSYRFDDNDLFQNATTWRVHGSVRLGLGLRVRAAAGTGIKAPGFDELFGYYDGQYTGNPDLKPEESKGWEVGFDQALFGDRLTIGATYFANKFNNEIYSTYQFIDGQFLTVPQNRDTHTRQKGVEAYAEARLGNGWRADLAYTYLDGKEDRDVLPQVYYVATPWHGQAVRRPKNIASFNLAYATADKPYSGALTVRYTGKQNDLAFIDPSYIPALVQHQAFTTVNLNGEYKLDQNLSVFARVENLFDEQYEQVFSFTAWGRSAYAGVRMKF
ncbi:TonB-dependent receptor [Aquisediminimonas sediminicola]|uniref:TonB-dependent receptor n=1 Tax=Alteraquisediminimonas sediminicola TaxID=2676787 RepID=UPI001C8EA1E7|nr:TonB-dependent receptor [Aquisediminimonas sediminicola]